MYILGCVSIRARRLMLVFFMTRGQVKCELGISEWCDTLDMKTIASFTATQR